MSNLVVAGSDINWMLKYISFDCFDDNNKTVNISIPNNVTSYHFSSGIQPSNLLWHTIYGKYVISNNINSYSIKIKVKSLTKCINKFKTFIGVINVNELNNNISCINNNITNYIYGYGYYNNGTLKHNNKLKLFYECNKNLIGIKSGDTFIHNKDKKSVYKIINICHQTNTCLIQKYSNNINKILNTEILSLNNIDNIGKLYSYGNNDIITMKINYIHNQHKCLLSYDINGYNTGIAYSLPYNEKFKLAIGSYNVGNQFEIMS